jgi:hypothetical protein
MGWRVEMHLKGGGGGDIFKQHVRFEVGNRSQALFWQDVWCGELPLKTAFLAFLL